MQYGGLFQTGNEGAGGWRFNYNDRPTSNAALQQVNAIDPEFLKKVAGMKPEEKKGLLDAALTAQPLQGLLNTGGAQSIGNDAQQSGSGASSESFGTSPGGNMARNDNSAGLNISGKGLGALGQFVMSGNPLTLAGLLGNVSQTAPVQSIVAPGLNGYISNNYGADPALTGAPTQSQAQAQAQTLAAQLAPYAAPETGGYGSSPTLNGAPDAAQAQALADALAASLAGYQSGGLFGGGLGGGGYGGFGGSTGGSDTVGFGGEY